MPSTEHPRTPRRARSTLQILGHGYAKGEGCFLPHRKLEAEAAALLGKPTATASMTPRRRPQRAVMTWLLRAMTTIRPPSCLPEQVPQLPNLSSLGLACRLLWDGHGHAGTPCHCTHTRGCDLISMHAFSLPIECELMLMSGAVLQNSFVASHCKVPCFELRFALLLSGCQQQVASPDLLFACQHGP